MAQIIERGREKFLVRIYLGRDAEGRRRYHNKTIHGGKKDAQRYARDMERKKDMGLAVEASRKTLNDHLGDWLEAVAKPRVRPQTFEDYKTWARLYLRPDLGDVPLAKLTAPMIQKTYSAMTSEGLSPATVRKAHAVLNSSLKAAVKWRLLLQNPAALVDLPRMERRELKMWTADEVAAFLAEAQGDPWHPAFLLSLSTGLRPGELWGLTWANVDLAESSLRVERVLKRPKGRAAWTLAEPKTSRSRRTVPLPSSTTAALQRHKKNQTAQQLAAAPGEWTDHGFVFTGENGEPAHHRNVVRRHFKPLVEAAGVTPITFYGLRHVHATQLLAQGVNVKVVSERLGHASVTTTLDKYAAVLPTMQQEAADAMEAVLQGR